MSKVEMRYAVIVRPPRGDSGYSTLRDYTGMVKKICPSFHEPDAQPEMARTLDHATWSLPFLAIPVQSMCYENPRMHEIALAKDPGSGFGRSLCNLGSALWCGSVH